jgi:hypothetical protein
MSQKTMTQPSTPFSIATLASLAACALACLLSACAHPQSMAPRPTAGEIATAIAIDTLQVDAKSFAEPFKVRVYLPPGYAGNAAR